MHYDGLKRLFENWRVTSKVKLNISWFLHNSRGRARGTEFSFVYWSMQRRISEGFIQLGKFYNWVDFGYIWILGIWFIEITVKFIRYEFNRFGTWWFSCRKCRLRNTWIFPRFLSSAARTIGNDKIICLDGNFSLLHPNLLIALPIKSRSYWHCT